MNPLTLIALLQALASFAGQVPALVEATNTAVDLLRSGRDPTPEEQARFDAALEAANDALQRS